jgi:hypothetical protein
MTAWNRRTRPPEPDPATCQHADRRLEVGMKGGFVLLRCSRCRDLLSSRPATPSEVWAFEQLGELPGDRR